MLGQAINCFILLQVHFRGYPDNILTPCDGEDSVKWSFINSLKEVRYNTYYSSSKEFSWELEMLHVSSLTGDYVC